MAYAASYQHLSIVTVLLSSLIACGCGNSGYNAVAAWIQDTGGLKIHTNCFLVSDDGKTCPSFFS